MTKSSSAGAPLSQWTRIVIGSWLPAAAPVIVFSTTSEPSAAE